MMELLTGGPTKYYTIGVNSNCAASFVLKSSWWSRMCMMASFYMAPVKDMTFLCLPEPTTISISVAIYLSRRLRKRCGLSKQPSCSGVSFKD